MAASRETVLSNLARVREEMTNACERAGRDLGSVTLVAAAKTVPVEAIGWVIDAGVTDVGQNYVQELRATRSQVPGPRWHFIGTLQSGSAHHVAALADVVETVTGGRAASRLARRAVEGGRRLDALIEVDFTGERSGVAPAALAAVADEIAALEGLRLAGLMTLPPLTPTAEKARPWFRRLRELGEHLRETHPEVLELSMGMSLDYAVAIEEGATMVRVGTALFGERRLSM